MNKFLFFTLLSLIIFTSDIIPQYPNPKSELRGVWIAALGIDWPSVTGTSQQVIENQKNQLRSIMDSHRLSGLNSIFLHMRPICDALYKSNIEPWSHYITGTQGTPPSDSTYDPLEFAIEEAHKRGMELHAWLNPYRAMTPGGSPTSPGHVINQHPEWIISCSGTQYKFLNPGLPAVREYVVQVIMDIVTRYDVDGIHFDDYFYPYTEYGPFNDDSTFAQYPNGFTNKADWRKNNVNMLLKMIDDSIKAVKPWIKFGISPSGNPSVNNAIYCDPAAWLAGRYTDSTGTLHTGEPYIDYILPQLYWSRYNNLLSTWANANFLNERHLYIGQAAYRFSIFPADELTWEITTNRSNPLVQGGVFFSSRSLTLNLGYGNDTLKYHYFTHPAVLPKIDWLDDGSGSPNPPVNLRFEQNTTTGKYELHWDKPAPTPNGDTAFFYVAYRSEDNPPDIHDSTNLFGLTGTTSLEATNARYSVTKGNYYVVTAIDRHSNESIVSNTATLSLPSLIPGEPVLVSPANGSSELGLSATLGWTGDSNSERYVVQVARDSTFNSDVVLWVWEYRNNQIPFRSVIPGEVYYWRVKAFGQVGESDFSDVYSFQSGIPLAPVLHLPPHGTLDVPLTPQFVWFGSEGATSYRFQLARTISFHDTSMVYNQIVNDTTFTVTTPLMTNRNHWWRVAAINSYGQSFWPTGFGFRTTATVDVEAEGIPTEFSLRQNYPNPFNPATEIEYSIAEQGFVSLKIYDLLGSEVATLVNEEKWPGVYKVSFNASELSSGIYIYRMVTEKFSASRKMIFMK
jgi:uncharacterized lipoprotein YddW (UPF0748 family)